MVYQYNIIQYIYIVYHYNNIHIQGVFTKLYNIYTRCINTILYNIYTGCINEKVYNTNLELGPGLSSSDESSAIVFSKELNSPKVKTFVF